MAAPVATTLGLVWDRRGLLRNVLVRPLPCSTTGKLNVAERDVDSHSGDDAPERGLELSLLPSAQSLSEFRKWYARADP